MQSDLAQIHKAIAENANQERALHSYKFFKAFPGGYGEGDEFNGMTVPDGRRIARKFKDNLSLTEVEQLLHSKIHEERLVALHLLVYKFERADSEVKQKIYELYLANTKFINNWDLVDTSSPHIVGKYLADKPDRQVIFRLAQSENLWEQRIAILSTQALIRNFQLDETFALSEILLNHSHDLMHKAVGWMLREAGDHDPDRLRSFLKLHYSDIPRTALRYAIEKFPETERKRFLTATF